MSTAIVLAALLSLAGSEWGLPGGGDQYIQFRDGKASGHSGCNRYTGGYTRQGEDLKFGPLAATKMAHARADGTGAGVVPDA